MFTTCDEAVDWITSRRNLSLGIESFRSLMSELDNPQDKIPSIHVAGTNGKGSTCTFIKDCLMEAGYKVATFTSPHLIKHQDRIRINGDWISDDDFLDLVNEYQAVIETHELNMFEIDFLLACLYFIRQHVDIMIIEVGLGGRLDCTNSMHQPMISIITSIGLDHMEYLGDTKEKIAVEKAGIIKQNGVCIVGDVEQNSMCEIVNISKRVNAKVLPVEKYTKISEDKFIVLENEYTIKSKASYQMKNATLAITALLSLKNSNKINIDEMMIQKGISKSVWEGRFEKIFDKPLVILDGAHNEDGIDALAEAVKICQKPWVFVFSALKDKQTYNMVKKLDDVADKVIVTQFDFYRVKSCEELQINKNIECIKDKMIAIKKGMSLVGKNGTLIICGSLYFISEVREELKKRGINNE